MPKEHAIQIRDLFINTLIFVNDVALIYKLDTYLQIVLQKLEVFSATTGMKINLGKIKFMIFGTRKMMGKQV